MMRRMMRSVGGPVPPGTGVQRSLAPRYDSEVPAAASLVETHSARRGWGTASRGGSIPGEPLRRGGIEDGYVTGRAAHREGAVT
jgi:hypothetical protein